MLLYKAYPNITLSKDNTWEELRNLKNKYDLPWLCSGDFNEILFGCEKEGGHPRQELSMQKFCSALEDCDLHDLGFIGDPYTWRNNHHIAARYIRERLDRAVANSAWRLIFPIVKVINGDPRHSDHRPIIIDVGTRERREWIQQMESLPKFEARWLEEDDCMARVEEAWKMALAESDTTLMEVQMRMLGELWEWDRNVLGELERKINNIKKELEKCRRQNISEYNVNREHLLCYKLQRLQDQQNVYWKQRAHNTWLTKGDRNTSFFHAFASKRKRKNFVRQLKDENGNVVVGEQLKNFIANHYQQLFMSYAGNDFEEVMNCVQPRVTQEMNDSLLMPFPGDEIWCALESIGDLKAPGADGMPSIFYKTFWSLIGDRVKEEVLGVLNGGPMPEGWNHTIIVLIPKIAAPQSIKDFRPISLCNVLYKLISKVLANRLKKILPNIISSTQSAFVPGRLITDNVLLAYELTHHLRSKTKGAGGLTAIKLDMSKAYDRVMEFSNENDAQNGV